MTKVHAKGDLKAPIYSNTKTGIKSCKISVILGGYLSTVQS